MITSRYKSFGFLLTCLVVFVLSGCGGRSETLVDESPVKRSDNGEDQDTNTDRSDEATAGTGNVDVNSATAGQPALSTAGAGSACFNAGTDPNRNKVQPGNICDRLSTIQCAGEACCCDNPNRDFSACKQGMMAYCREQLRIDIISQDASTGFDPVLAEQVFAQYEQKSSQCDTNVVFWGTSLEGLRGVIKGTIEPGRPCTPRNDWGETLDEAGAAALASCKDPATTACSHPAPLLWTCSPRVDVGDRCITDLNCLDDLYCDNPNLMLLGATCKPRKNTGSACTLPNECQTMICKSGKCAEVNQQNVYCLSQ